MTNTLSLTSASPARHRAGRRAVALAAMLAMAGALTAAGCSPAGVVVGAGAVVATSAMEERGVDGAAVDTAIRAEINGLWLGADHRLLTTIGLTVHERRVLLTGRTTDADLAALAVSTAREAARVVEVINAISVVDSSDLGDTTRDILIANGLRSDLLFDREIRSINYSVAVSDRIVHIIGVAQNQRELDRVLSYARNARYVRDVVSHVLMQDDPRRARPLGEQGGAG